MAEYFPRVLLSLNTDEIFYWSLLLQIIIVIIIIIIMPDYYSQNHISLPFWEHPSYA